MEHPGFVRIGEAKETPHLRLLCVPHSGGDASSFRSWALDDPCLEVWSVRLPGRGSRLHEKPFRDWQAAVNEILLGLHAFFLDGVPFAILGHSLGALLGFEVARLLASQGLQQPTLFLASSHAPPWKKISGLQNVQKMKPSEMLPLLSKLGILSKEASMLQNESVSTFLPTLQADLEMYNSYSCIMPPFRMQQTAVIALVGLSDTAISLEDMQEWDSHCQDFELKGFAGGHFYWQDAWEEVHAYLVERLRSSLRVLPASVHSRFGGWVENPSPPLCALTTLISRHPPNISTIEDTYERVSLGELRARSYSLAVGLGDVQRATVAILLHHDIAFVTAMLAIWQSNGCMMVLDKSFPPDLVAESLDLAGARLLLVAADLLHKVKAEGMRVVMHERFGDSGGSAWKGLLAPSLFCRIEDVVDLNSPAYLVFTSGTSGKPKMVVCSHRSASFGHLSRAHVLPYSAGEKEGVNIMFSWEVLRGVVQGTDVACIPDSVVTDPSSFLGFIKKHAITRFLATPSLLRALLDAPEIQTRANVLRSLKVVYSCGEALPLHTARKFQSSFPEATLVNVYSSWEGGDLAIYKVPDSMNGWPVCRSVVPVG
ncbi:grsT, partial [Symbiodinium sp. CCMP2592]